jgi:hypothetical protein
MTAGIQRVVSDLAGGLFGFRFQVTVFLAVLEALGWTVTWAAGRRTPAEQNRLHRENPSNPSFVAGVPSKHVDGEAIDLNLLRQGVSLRRDTARLVWQASGVVTIAKLCGIAWGGDFKNYGPNGDPNHFYLLS